jgi:AmmeMemoRadiSam system protein B
MAPPPGRPRHLPHILQLDTHIRPEQACGAYPVNGLLLAARQRGLAPQLIHRCNSGDTAGDKQRVVGYAAFAFHGSKRCLISAPSC